MGRAPTRRSLSPSVPRRPSSSASASAGASSASTVIRHYDIHDSLRRHSCEERQQLGEQQTQEQLRQPRPWICMDEQRQVVITRRRFRRPRLLAGPLPRFEDGPAASRRGVCGL